MFYKCKVAMMKKIIAKKQKNKPFDYAAAESYSLPADADETVNNSYYFSAHGQAQSLYCRLGIRKNHAEVWFTYSESGKVYTLKQMIFKDSPLKVARIDGGWSVSFVGELACGDGQVAASFDGQFFSEEPPTDFFSNMPAVRTAKAMAFEKWNKKFFAAVQENNQVHYEQTGILRGELQLGGQIRQIDLPCVRDHSFGKRDWEYMNNHLWLMAVNEKSQLNFSMVSYPAMTMLEVGNFNSGSGRAYILKAEYDRGALATGAVPEEFSARLRLDDKKVIDVALRVESRETYLFKDGKYILNECIADVTADGEKFRGIFEVGYNSNAERIFNGVPVRKLKA